jgi:RHS repeat-associated protein
VGYTYDAFGSLASAYYEDGTYDYKLPDEVGNLYKTESKKDRVYGRGGKLLQDPDWYYGYDGEGNLQIKSKHSLSDNKDNKEATQREWHAGDWWYEWNANGMLRSVKRPDGLVVEFEYDALGRRTAKVFKDKITRFVWDGNVLLHEWQYDVADRPQQVVNDIGEILLDREEPVENLITWIYEEGSFVPSGKIINDEKFSIVSDYIGRPVQAFAEGGQKVWETDYSIYGALRNVKGEKCFVPFRQLGQYEDGESGLYYNRFRYYSAETGTYLSQDPTKLKGGNAFYSYVLDSNFWIDIFGLTGTYAFTDGTTFYIGKGDHGRMLASIRQRVGTGNAIRSQHVDFGNSDMGLMVEAELMDRHNAVGDPTFANAINSPGKKKLAAASPAVRATVITNADAFETSYKAAHGGICL